MLFEYFERAKFRTYVSIYIFISIFLHNEQVSYFHVLKKYLHYITLTVYKFEIKQKCNHKYAIFDTVYFLKTHKNFNLRQLGKY